jgi:hypothetical protein
LFRTDSGLPPETARALAPTVTTVGSVQQVEQVEWDALVALGDPGPADAHLCLLLIDPNDAGMPAKGIGWTLKYTASTKAHEMFIPVDSDARIARLVEQDLVPSLQGRETNYYATWFPAPGFDLIEDPAEDALDPFLLTRQGQVLAGRFVRPGGVSETWFLPRGCNRIAWARLALECWSERYPDRFPPRGADWESSEIWKTTEEVDAERRLADLREERARAIDAFDQGERAALEFLGELRKDKDLRERRLFMAQGRPLVDAVIDALSELGFDVSDMDKTAQPGDLLEDLRVLPGPDLAKSAWAAVVEVRGYKGGAKIGDLMRLQRFAQRYEAEQKRSPSACWYVVNQFIGADPAERPEVLAEQPEEVDYFTQQYAGALLDTAVLFRIVMAARAGRIARSEIAEKLMTTAGRVSLSTPIRKWVNVRNRLMQPAPGLSAAVRPGRDGDRAG